MHFLLALCIIAGQFGYLDIGFGIRLYVAELLLVFFIARYTYTFGLRPLRQMLRLKPLVMWVWIVFLGWVMGIATASISDNIRSLAYILRLGLLIVGTHCLYRSPSHKKVSALLYVIPAICMIQYILLPDLRLLQQYGWDPHMYRAVGTIFDPPVVGSILGLLWFSFLMTHATIFVIPAKAGMTKKFLNKHVYLFGVVIFASMIFLYSRSTYLSLLIVTSLYLLSKSQYVYVVLFVLIAILSIYVAPLTIPPTMNLESAKIGRMSTATSRMTEIREGIHAWSTSRIIGIGYNRVSEYKRHLNAKSTTTVSNHADSAFHSFWVTQLATTGIGGVALLLGCMGLLIRWRSELFLPAALGIDHRSI
jgi:hypothetical protein